jgi:curved DNA-binding protein CbpA
LASFDWYDVLGVAPDASEDELRRAHRSAVRELHPDTRDPGLPPADADEALRLVNQAWEVLGDPARRADYDAARWDDREDREVRADPLVLHGTARFPWWIVALAILLVIFVFTAYAGVPTTTTR